MSVHDDLAWLDGLVRRLTVKHESAAHPPGGEPPWQVEDAPTGYIAGQLRAIVGVEVVISRIEAKAKLSQNRSDADQAGAIAGLDEAGQSGLAEAMRKVRR